MKNKKQRVDLTILVLFFLLILSAVLITAALLNFMGGKI
jgi:hypothetical protein